MNKQEQIIDYFRVGKVGREANHLEEEALRDPFLYEALEGMEGIDVDHDRIIADMQRQICQGSKRGTHSVFYGWSAAVVLVLGGVAFWMFYTPQEYLPIAEVREVTDSVMQKVSSGIVIDTTDGTKYLKDELVLAKEVKVISYRKNSAPMAANTSGLMQGPVKEKSLATVSHQQKSEEYISDTTIRKPEIQTEKPFPVLKENKVLQQDSSVTIKQKRQKRIKNSKLLVNTDLRKEWSEEFQHYLQDSLRYPEDARIQEIEGEVVLSVHLNKRLGLSRIKIVRKLFPSCDREAVRLVEKYPGLWGGEVRDFAVTIKFSLKSAVN